MVRSPIPALVHFHARSGARVAQRNSIAGLCIVLFAIGSAPEPLLLVRGLVLDIASTGGESFGLVALAALAVALGAQATRTAAHGAVGWLRALPASGVEHRRAVVLAMVVVQAPVLLVAGASAALAAAVFDATIDPVKLVAVLVIVLGAGVAAVPAQRAAISMPLALAAVAAAAIGGWDWVALSLVLLAAADGVAGALAPPPPVRRRSVDGGALFLRTAWRAIGWRAVGPFVPAAIALAFCFFYLVNNPTLTTSEGATAARLCGGIALLVWHAILADVLALRRPGWPWARSLPCSSTTRVVFDAAALALPAAGIIAFVAALSLPAAVPVAATLPTIALLGAAGVRRAHERITGAGGITLLTGIPLVVALAMTPWAGLVALFLAPLALRHAAHLERRQRATAWAELHRDAAGDSLSWSAR